MKKLQFIKFFLSSIWKRYQVRLIYVGGALIFFGIVIYKFGFLFYPQEEIYEGIVGYYNAENLPTSVTNLISQPLVNLDKTGKPQPQIAQGWQVNNDSTVYTFNLKENLYWSDGSRLKSSDIKFNLLDVEVRYPDERTIAFKLADSYSPFSTFLTSPVLKNNSFIGINGQYKITYQEKNNDLITKLVLKPIMGDLPIIKIRFYPDEKTAKTAFELGEIEVLIGFSSETELVNQASVKSKKITNFNKLVAIFYNTSDKVLSDKNLRKALSFATPIIEGEERAKTSIPPFSWAYNDQLKEVGSNLEMAKSYFSKVQNSEESQITLTTTPALSLVGEKIIEFWKTLGVQAVLRIESGVPQNFQALLTTQTISIDPDQYLLWHSTQVQTNLTKYNNKRLDKDLEDGRKTGDLEKRREKYLDFQRVLQEDSPAHFLYFPKTVIVYRQKVEGSLNKVINLQVLTN